MRTPDETIRALSALTDMLAQCELTDAEREAIIRAVFAAILS